MDYRRNLNQMSAKDSVHRTLINLIRYQASLHKSPYISKQPDLSMDGPGVITSHDQEVSTSPVPTYSSVLAGRFHLNK